MVARKSVVKKKPAALEQPKQTPLPAFTLRQLEAFTTVALSGSVSAAANRLSRTQSAVSMALQDLEAALGASLFERRGRRLVRTDAAAVLLPRAIEMVDRAREIRELINTDQGSGVRLAIGASRTIGPFIMPELLQRCRSDLEGTQILLTVTNSKDLLDQVRQFELDYAFIEGNVTDPTLTKQPWLDDRLCLFARSGHPIFKSSSRLANRLSDSQWVLREPGSGTREVFLQSIGSLLPRPSIALEVDDPETQKRLVRQSDWLSCISRRAIVNEPLGSGLREITGLPLSLQRALTRQFWIVRHPDRFNTRSMQILLSAAQEMRRR